MISSIIQARTGTERNDRMAENDDRTDPDARRRGAAGRGPEPAPEPAAGPDPAVRAALGCLDVFRRRALPSALRRLACWKGLTAAHGDVVEDLSQELALDCIENAAEIVALGERDRHGRWFRLVQQQHYRLRQRPHRNEGAGTELDRLPGSCPPLAATALDLEDRDRRLLRLLSAQGSRLKNGRVNAERTARELGVSPTSIRRLWRTVAERLGYGPDYVAFWRGRLVEALCGMAAAQLIATGALRVFDEAGRRLPTPAEGSLRLRRIKRALGIMPQQRELCRVLVRWTTGAARGGKAPSIDACELLDDALTLRPCCARIQLWRFEAAVACGDLSTAARCLRRAREHGAERVPVLLARARLMEAGRRIEAARRLLRRGLGRHGRDRRLVLSLGSLYDPA